MPAFRVVNVTHQKTPRGHFLDFGEKANKILGAGKQTVIQAESYEMLPDFVHDWVATGQAKVFNATGGEQLSGSVSGEITPASLNPAREVRGEEFPDVDDFTEDEPDLSTALDAALPHEQGGAISQSTAQMASPKAKVSLGLETESYQANDGLSPIPGDRPRSVDNSDAFTVRAKGGKHVGGVIR